MTSSFPLGSAVIPEQVGRYRILDLLGQGSMGQVFVAYDPNIERKVALKVLMPSLRVQPEAEADFQKRFIIEARTAGRLNHPGIVAIHDAAIDPKSHLAYMAMELVEGASLGRLLYGRKRLSVSASAAIARQVALALDYAHQQGIVHRDVKPANILIGTDGRVRVLDFGIAKLTTESHTLGGQILGTPAYMSPEQVRGQSLDGRSDLFSLGAVLYQCLSGRGPFGGDTVATIVYEILNLHPPSPPDGSEDLPADLWRIVDRTLSKDVDGRFERGLELARALEAYVPSPTDDIPDQQELQELAAQGLEAPRGSPEDSPQTATKGTFVFAPSETSVDEKTLLLGPPSDRRTRRAGWLAGALFAVTLVALGAVLALRWLGPPVAVVSPPESSQVTPPLEPDSVADESAAPDDDESLGEEAPSEPSADVPSPARVESRSRSTPASKTTEREPTKVDVVAPLPSNDLHDASAEGSPVDLAETSDTSTATLVLVHENRLEDAYLSIWIDQERVRTRALEMDGGFFARLRGETIETVLPITAGYHEIEVRVTGVKGKVDSAKITYARFSEGETRLLRAKLAPFSRTLRLDWRD